VAPCACRAFLEGPLDPSTTPPQTDTKEERAWEDLVTDRAVPPPAPLSQGGEKRRNEIGMNAQLVQDRLFNVPGRPYPLPVRSKQPNA